MSTKSTAVICQVVIGLWKKQERLAEIYAKNKIGLGQRTDTSSSEVKDIATEQ